LLVIVGAAPIAFVAPRGLASYYIPLAGYALFLAVLMIYARERISRTAVARAAMFVLVFLCMWTWQWWQRRDLSSVSQEYAVISDAIRQIRSHPEWLRPNSEILIASDSFREEFEWASTFVTLLAAHDRSIRVYILRDADPKPGPGELRKYTTVIGYQNGTYVDLTDQARAQGL
jgi:hypothetical protein